MEAREMTAHKRYVDEALAWFRRWKLHAPAGAVEDLARIFERAEARESEACELEKLREDLERGEINPEKRA